MLKLRNLVIVAMLFAFVAAPSFGATYKTETGRFILSATDDLNLNPDGSIKPVAGRVGQYRYDLKVTKGDFVKKIPFNKPQTNNVVVMKVAGSDALLEEGTYVLTVQVVNVVFTLGGGIEEYTSPPKIAHTLIFEKPVPPTPTPVPTPEPTPVPPTPTPVPPAVPEQFDNDSQFHFDPLNETDFGG